jgi:hypothetical protein
VKFKSSLRIITSFDRGEEFVAHRQERTVSPARNHFGLHGNHFDEDVVVYLDGLALLKIIRALKSAYGEVDLVGALLVFKS